MTNPGEDVRRNASIRLQLQARRSRHPAATRHRRSSSRSSRRAARATARHEQFTRRSPPSSSRRRLQPAPGIHPAGYAPPSTGYEAPPSYQPPTAISRAAIRHRLSAVADYPPPPEYPAPGVATAWLPAAPRPVPGPARVRRAVLSRRRHRDTAIRHRPRLPPAASGYGPPPTGYPARIRRRLRAAGARRPTRWRSVAGGLADRHSLHHRFARRHRARRVALNQIKETRQGGHGLAIAGIAVGVVTLFISVIWIDRSPSAADDDHRRPQSAAVPRRRVPAAGAVGAAARSVCARRLSDGFRVAAAGLPAAGYPRCRGYPPGYPGYYPAGYDPYRPGKPPGTNGKAIAALVTALAGLVLLRPAVDRGSDPRHHRDARDASAPARTATGSRWPGPSSADWPRRLGDLPRAVDRHLRQRMAVGAVAGRGREEH